MKKWSLIFTVVLILALCCGGCKKTEDKPAAPIEEKISETTEEVSSEDVEDKESTTTEVETIADKEWKDAYKALAKDLLENQGNEETSLFAIKDLDNNGILELIILKEVELTVYTYKDEVSEVGKYDFTTATTRFLYSEKKSYPGIFYTYVSGGWNQYGYLTISDNKLVTEELWSEDFSGISSLIGEESVKKYSSNKKLIKESKKIYYNSQDLEFEELSVNEIENILS